MKKIIITTFFILHIFCSSILAADWEYFATGASDDVFFYDKESIVYPYKKKMLWGMANVKDKNRLRIWILLKYSYKTQRKHETETRQYYNDQAAPHFDRYKSEKDYREKMDEIINPNKPLYNLGGGNPSPSEKNSLRKAEEYKRKADAYVAPKEKTYSIIIDCEKETADLSSISPNSVYRSLLKKVCN